GEHNTNWISSYPFCSFSDELREETPEHPKTKGDVIIGNDVWLGSYATIMSGVTVGDGAVIGARAVVAKDVEPYSIVVGNPAREVRKRFGPEEIEYLLELKWWDWDADAIERVAPILMSEDFDALRKFKP
ncbi:MAG: CatB-related O-acetyltransferase, partial [Deltaproteobacteria bacterium]|nr:CatB-related O-acetyltransferase [Deltaproteobacteria bacterium]